jgi:prevent-host-death family protein
MQISQARKQLSRLVERVAAGGAPIAIGRYGTERAILISVNEYRQLKNAARAAAPPTLEGTVTLECSPEELIAESRRLGNLWLARIDRAQNEPRSRRRRHLK